MNQYARSHSHRESLHQKHKFYKHLKAYLLFVGIMLAATFFSDDNPNFYPVAFWWGMGVVVHYLRTFGWGNPAERQYREQYEGKYELPAEPEEEEFVELRQPQKAWRDRDLV